MTDVSVIIVNFKTSALVADCINSIRRHTKGVTIEIIVADNNSEPNLESIIANACQQMEDIRVIQLNENVGFGRANNAALDIAKGRNILFLNPDTVLLNNAIKILSDFLDANPKAGACGGNLYNEEMQPALSHKMLVPGIRWEMADFLHNAPIKLAYGKNWDHNHNGAPLQVAYITGADLMVRKSALEATGPFDSRFFLYFEETELCVRIRRHGYTIWNVPKAKIQHLDGQSMKTDAPINRFKIETQERSRNIFYRLTTHPIKHLLADTIYQGFLLSRQLLSKDAIKKERYRLRRAYHKSTKN